MSSSEWLFTQVRLALLHPRRFARSLTTEHYGLAPLIVAVAAGVALSLSLDLLAVASRELDPTPFIPRFLVDALFLSARVAVVIAVVSFVGARILRLVHRDEAPTLEEIAAGVGFAVVPLLVALPIALLAAIAPVLGVVATVALVLLALRVVYGLAAVAWSLLPPISAAIALVLLVAAGGYALQDQITRAAFITYGYFPQLARPLASAGAQGTTVVRSGMTLTVPDRWHRSESGVPGELVRFETDRDTLVATSQRGNAFLTPADLADDIARGQLRGMTDRSSRRDVVRIGEMLAVDDRHVGNYEGRRIAIRQFTTVRGTSAYALVFRSIEPADPEAAFAEDAAIAASWRLGPP